MPAEFAIAETDTFTRVMAKREFVKYYDRLRRVVYPALRKNPLVGPNIKHLKGEHAGLLRYRMGDYRLVYSIDHSQKLVFLRDFQHRKDVYKRK